MIDFGVGQMRCLKNNLDGRFEELYNRVETVCSDKKQLEDYVLREAFNRFKDIVSILVKRHPKEFVK